MTPRRQPKTTNHSFSTTLWCFLAGAVGSLSLPPLFFLPAIFALSIPLLAYLRASSWSSAGQILWSAGFGWFLASTFWVSNSLIIKSPSLWFLAPFLAISLALCLGLFWGLAAIVSWPLGRLRVARILWFVVCFCFFEWSRGFVATGFPWNLPGMIFSVDLASLQLASVFGVYGMTVFAVFFAISPVFWSNGNRNMAVFFVIMPFIFAGIGLWRLDVSTIEKNTNQKIVRLVQPVISQDEKWNEKRRDQHLKILTSLSTDTPPTPKLVIWPETAFSGYPSIVPNLFRETARLATTRDGHLITGVPRISRDKKLLNSAILVNNNGDFIATYDKRHLVPFGEYIPFRNILPSINAIVGPVDFASGQRGPLMTLANYGRVSVLICYEIIFSGSIVEPVNRPEIIINITNDAWFGESAGPWQHFFQARFRAVEEGLPLLRVANTGISVGFDGHGRQLGIIPLGHRAAIDVEVPEALAPTLFAQFGNMFFFGLLLVIGTVAVSVDVSRSIRH